MTVAELIEKLLTLQLDAEVVFQEMRYTGGGDEWYETDIDVWQNGSTVYLTPDCDTEHVRYNLERYGHPNFLT